MLTRELLFSGRYLDSFTDLPQQARWTEEQIRLSMARSLAQRGDGPLWVFAYGSLIWNPLFHYAEQQEAQLTGWHRSFCMKLNAGRGSVEQPGRMLSLQAGGHTQGVAFRLHEENLEQELWLIWAREMVYGSYLPIWVPIQLQDKRSVNSIVFVADPSHAHYEAQTGIEHIAPIIRQAQGVLGSNVDYVLQLALSLDKFGIRDDYIHALSQALTQD